MNNIPITETAAYEVARRNLNAFVKEQAKRTAHRVGFGWKAIPNAPDTYPALEAAYRRSLALRKPLPVSSLYCNTTLYGSPELNHAVRFWHDMLHMETRLTFDLADELELGLYHLHLADKEGIKKGTLEWRMMRVDFLAQNYLIGIASRFPLNQKQFVDDCLMHGLDEGILIESRRHLEAA